MFLPRDTLLPYKCELNHHVDLITVYGGLRHGFNSVLQPFTFLFNKKQPARKTGIESEKKNQTHIVWSVSSCLWINARPVPSREKDRDRKSTFCNMLSWLGPKCFPEKQTFHVQSGKKSPRESLYRKTALILRSSSVFVALWRLFLSFGRGQNQNAEGKLLMRLTAPLHTSLYFHDFPHVEMFGFSRLLTCHVTPLNRCDCD